MPRMSPIFRADRSDAAASTTHAIMRDESRSRNTTKRRTAPTRRTSSQGANGVPNGIGYIPVLSPRHRDSQSNRSHNGNVGFVQNRLPGTDNTMARQAHRKGSPGLP